MEFAEYEPLPDGMTGHPKGAVWFCERHHEAAQALKDHRSGAALKRLRRKYWMSWWLRRLVSR